MYETLRNDLMTHLCNLPSLSITSVLDALDVVAYKYDIRVKETRLDSIKREIPYSVKVFLMSKQIAGFSEDTLYSYMLCLKQFFKFTNKEPKDVQPNDIRVFLYAYRELRKVTNQTLEQYRGQICSYFKWAYTEGYIPKDPSVPIQSIKCECKERGYLSPLELEYLRGACKTLRETAILELLYSTGCRVSELCGCTLEDVNLVEGTIHLYGKGKKHRTSFLNAKAEVSLRAYLNSRKDDNPYLIVSEYSPHKPVSSRTIEVVINSIYQRVSDKITTKVTPHVIRHTTATIALRRGMPVEQIQQLLGHSNLNTTMVYAKTSLEIIKADHQKYVL